MGESMKTELVSAIYLQEVELQERPADAQQDAKINNNGQLTPDTPDPDTPNPDTPDTPITLIPR